MGKVAVGKKVAARAGGATMAEDAEMVAEMVAMVAMVVVAVLVASGRLKPAHWNSRSQSNGCPP